MSAAQPIGPGSIVVCIATFQNEMDVATEYRLTKDALYCVEFIRPWGMPCPVDDCAEGLVLKGRTTPCLTQVGPCYMGYCPSQFRPLNDGDTSSVTEEETYDDIIGAGLQTYRVKTPEPA